MTKEEALFKVEGYLTYYLSPNDYKEVEEIVKALNQEPCEDTVSRQAVIETIFIQGSAEKLEIDFAKLLLLQRAIKALPSVIPQETRWIPCSENLPKKDGEYYTTIYDNDNVSDKYLDIGEFEDGEWQYKDSIKVLAWMPLPKVYEPKESEGEE